jgi:hypothetical protein
LTIPSHSDSISALLLVMKEHSEATFLLERISLTVFGL